MIVTGAKASSPRRLALLHAPSCSMVVGKRARQAGDEMLVIGNGPPRLSCPYRRRRGQMDDVMAELNALGILRLTYYALRNRIR
jgi:hypothetical protein